MAKIKMMIGQLSDHLQSIIVIPTGLCGTNAYCTLKELKVVCTCPPGFDFLDPGQHNLVCKRNTSTNGCASINKETVDTIQELASVEWEDNPY